MSGDTDQEKAQLFNYKPNRRHLTTNTAEILKKKKKMGGFNQQFYEDPFHHYLKQAHF